MQPAALGFRVHSGWTSLIAVALAGNRPVILVRQRPHLVATFSYAFRQPYHTARKMTLAEAKIFLTKQRKEARRLALAAIRSAQSFSAQQGFLVSRAALLVASGRALPRLPQILASHSLIHSADGEFFREALLYACDRASLPAIKFRDRDLVATASSDLGRTPAKLTQIIAAVGKPLGSPWTADEKLATLAAWRSLAARG